MKTISAAAGGQRDSPSRDSLPEPGEDTATASSSLRTEPTRNPQNAGSVSSAPVTESPTAERRVELTSTLLLALATLATAWSAYQSRQWTGEQSQAYSRATATRIAVNRVSALANRQVQIDVATFIEWVDAREQGRTALADFYRARFRDEFKPAFAAWLAAKPFERKDAPPTPFAMPQYRLEASTEADRLETTAASDSNDAKEANQTADNYMLAVVLFASALFFAGISTKLQTPRARAAILGLGWVLFLGTVIWVATFPTRLSV